MGTDLTLTCTTTTSKPPATISWYRGTEKLSDSDKGINIGNIEYSDGEYNGETSEQQITITTTAKDNKADFKCIARNPDVGGDVDSNSITTNVYFPPRYPSGCSTQLHGYPDNTGYVVAGNALTLTCMSCSSNPDADVQWYHGTQVVTSGLSDVSYHDGVYEGQTTTQNLTIQLSYHHHMDIFNCDAGNVYFASRESSNTVILNVR
ncbi:nephrin-like, partial [Saccoglossus kowalevskii]|uniref:Nephrin-like n=1 Tax=Saccoglossus kowalevskii TaxID=10224 RepID=A0ABM0MCC1_SACKO